MPPAFSAFERVSRQRDERPLQLLEGSSEVVEVGWLHSTGHLRPAGKETRPSIPCIEVFCLQASALVRVQTPIGDMLEILNIPTSCSMDIERKEALFSKIT